MRAQTALGFLCAACACTGHVLAWTIPCRFFEFFQDATGTCVPCTEHTFGTREHCALYNTSLPWADASSVFARLQLKARADECEQYTYESSEPILRWCDHLGTNGELEHAVVLTPTGGTPTAYGVVPPPTTPESCPQGAYRVNATSCMKCPNNTTTDAGNKAADSDCEWCELGYRWRPETRACEPCPQCYTTRPDPDTPHAKYTRAEHCSPCSVWADDYRRGGCDATVAGQCVLHVPYADVHAVHMEPEPDAYNESWRGVFCSYEVWRKTDEIRKGTTNQAIDRCKNENLVPGNLIENLPDQVDMYVYKARTQKVHALFRPQSREHVHEGAQKYASANAAYSGAPPQVYNYTYTTGTALPGIFEDLWSSHFINKALYVYDVQTGVVPPPFELAGSYTYSMHNVAPSLAPYYDFARAYHEHWLLGVLAPAQRACVGQDAGEDLPSRRKLQEYGVLLCVNASQDQHRLYDMTTESQSNCQSEAKCDVLHIGCDNPNDNPSEPFCNSAGGSVDAWKALGFYLYNATREYQQMEQNVQEWEQSIAEQLHDTAPESAACDSTVVDLRILVTNAPASAPAVVHGIRVRNLVNNDVLYTRDIAHELAPGSQAFVHNASCTVASGASIQVEALVSNGTGVQVRMLHAESELNVTTTPALHVLEHQYTLCAEDTDAQLVSVDTPASFGHLHTFLHDHLCEYM